MNIESQALKVLGNIAASLNLDFSHEIEDIPNAVDDRIAQLSQGWADYRTECKETIGEYEDEIKELETDKELDRVTIEAFGEYEEEVADEIKALREAMEKLQKGLREAIDDNDIDQVFEIMRLFSVLKKDEAESE